MHLHPPRLLIASALCLLTASACTATPPGINTPDDRPPRTATIYADVVLGFGNRTDVTSCASSLPVCGRVTDQMPGPCVDNAALGKPDGSTYPLPPLGVIELGFLCDTILEVGTQGGASYDFFIDANVDANAQPVVEVSQDGTDYVVLNPWLRTATGFADRAGFQLEAQSLHDARFVRITETSGLGSIRIDAIEALPLMASP